MRSLQSLAFQAPHAEGQRPLNPARSINTYKLAQTEACEVRMKFSRRRLAEIYFVRQRALTTKPPAAAGS